MNKEKIKIGILGCGRVCEHYIQKIFISERVGDLYEVVAVCDVDINKSTYVASMFSCKSYNNIQEFVQQKNICIYPMFSIIYFKESEQVQIIFL